MDKSIKQQTIHFSRKLLNPGFESIAWQILYRVQIMGIGMTLVYICYDLFFNEGEKNTIIALLALPFYFFLLRAIIKYPDNKIVRNFIVVSNFISLIMSFVFLGEHFINTPTVIDFSLSLLVITIVFRGWERIVWALLHAALLILFITLSLRSYSQPSPHAADIIYYTDLWFSYVEVFSRLIFIFMLGLTFIQVYDRQRQLVIIKNEEVVHLNKNLEELVKIRTERLNELNTRLREYSALNSHKVRAPLARMMGIMNLIGLEKIDPKNEILDNYINLLQQTATELDTIIREMNSYLSQQDKEGS